LGSRRENTSWADVAKGVLYERKGITSHELTHDTTTVVNGDQETALEEHERMEDSTFEIVQMAVVADSPQATSRPTTGSQAEAAREGMQPLVLTRKETEEIQEKEPPAAPQSQTSTPVSLEQSRLHHDVTVLVQDRRRSCDKEVAKPGHTSWADDTEATSEDTEPHKMRPPQSPKRKKKFRSEKTDSIESERSRSRVRSLGKKM
jgi:hypothetical protein